MVKSVPHSVQDQKTQRNNNSVESVKNATGGGRFKNSVKQETTSGDGGSQRLVTIPPPTLSEPKSIPQKGKFYTKKRFSRQD